MAGANHEDTVTRVAPRSFNLKSFGIESVASTSALKAGGAAAIAPIMSEVVIAYLQLFGPLGTTK